VKRRNMQQWAESRFGPDWRRKGVVVMETWAALTFGPNWRARLKPTVTGYKAAPSVTLTVDKVMPDCRDWFLAHTPGEGWKQRVIVNSGLGTDVLRAAKRRIERGDWEYCAICRLPVYQNEREPLPGGRARHPFCDPILDRDAPDTPASGIVDASKEPTYDQSALPV